MYLLLYILPVFLLALLQTVSSGSLARHDGEQVGSVVIGKPEDVSVSCFNLNYTLQWRPPISKGSEDTLYYTVLYFRPWPYRWLPVSSCVNITATSCNLVEVFNSYQDIYLDLQVSVEAHDKLGNRGASVNVTFNPLTDATVGAPRIQLDRITSNEVSLTILAPLSPFDNKLVTEFLTETAIKYNISFWKSTGLQQLTKIKIKENRVAASVDNVYLGNLVPDTSYRLTVQTSYETISATKYSPDVASISFTTSQRQPSYGPDVSLGSISQPDCSQPHQRNITIHWKIPPEKFQNGKITSYTIVWREKTGLVTTNYTSRDTSQNRFILKNLSRWKAYEVSVIATNNGGGTPSAWLTISSHTLDGRSSQPQDLQVESNEDSVLASWQPPSLYPECILGYSFIYQWDSLDGRETRQVAVYNATTYRVKNLQPASYTFLVAPYIWAGYKNTTTGIAASITYPLTGDKGGSIISWSPIVAVLCIVVAVSLSCVILVCLWRRDKLNSILGLHKFNLDGDNKVLKFARSYTSPGIPVQRVEPEYFDATVATKHNQSCVEVGGTSISDYSQHGICVEKLNVQCEGGYNVSQDAPILTPDVGFSCFHFRNPLESLKKQNNYGKVDTLGRNGKFLSSSESDLYIQSEKMRDDIESCKLLPGSKLDELSFKADNINPYCKMSQLPSLRRIQYARLNSYSESDIPGKQGNTTTNQIAADEPAETEDVFQPKYCDQQLKKINSAVPAHQNKDNDLHDSLDVATQEYTIGNIAQQMDFLECAEERKTLVPRQRLNRADSYTYSQLAIAGDEGHYVRSDGSTPEQPTDVFKDITNTSFSNVLSNKKPCLPGFTLDLPLKCSNNDVTKLDRDIKSSSLSVSYPCSPSYVPGAGAVKCGTQESIDSQLPNIPSQENNTDPDSPLLLPDSDTTDCRKRDDIEPYILLSEL